MKKQITKIKNMKSEITERIKSPTPKFFKNIRTIGLTLGAIGGALLTAPISLPATIVSIAGYLATAGVVASAISTVAKEDK
jgi:ABC-type xylose transport system permease subunit